MQRSAHPNRIRSKKFLTGRRLRGGTVGTDDEGSVADTDTGVIKGRKLYPIRTRGERQSRGNGSLFSIKSFRSQGLACWPPAHPRDDGPQPKPAPKPSNWCPQRPQLPQKHANDAGDSSTRPMREGRKSLRPPRYGPMEKTDNPWRLDSKPSAQAPAHTIREQLQ